MKTVLVIDDDPLICDSLKDLLELHGFRPLVATSGRMGLNLATQQRPDLILCDVQMPEMDGYTVLQRVRQNPVIQTTPFVFLTAWAEMPQQRRGMVLGADDYLTKPCNMQDLLAALNSRLNRQELVQAQTQAALDTLRSSIATSLPHEFRTPLSGILASVELLRLLLDDSDQAADLLQIADTIQTSAQRLYRLIQNYLMYSKLEIAIRDPNPPNTFPDEATLNPQVEITDIATHVATQVDRLEDLQLDLQNAAIAFSVFDLEKVISELLDNAFKFSTPNSPVTVTSWVEGDTFQIQITNQGRGMTAAEIAALGGYMQFNRAFYEQQGVGLGLAIAQRLLQLRQASLTIASIPDQSTTVTVSIPLAVTDTELRSM
jgi:DNA-binding response OmpR family regulator